MLEASLFIATLMFRQAKSIVRPRAGFWKTSIFLNSGPIFVTVILLVIRPQHFVILTPQYCEHFGVIDALFALKSWVRSYLTIAEILGI